MMGIIRKARTACRATAFALVLMLFLSFPRPNHAFLTELVVGGELAFSALGLISQALPQIALVATNMVTLVNTGKMIVDQIAKIGKIISGQAGGQGSEPPPVVANPEPPAGGGGDDVPQIPLEGDVKGSQTQAGGSSVGSSDLADGISVVVDTFKRKTDLYNKISQLPEGSAGRDQLATPYSNLVNSNEQAIGFLTTVLLDAVRDGNQKTVEAFAKEARGLDAASRPALLPVLNRIVERGRFATLNGESAGDFSKLETLHAELTK